MLHVKINSNWILFRGVIMQTRRAQVKDIPAIMKLLSQVLEIHASIRPDIFIPGTTKYTVEELTSSFCRG
jgi:hypothetical protein